MKGAKCQRSLLRCGVFFSVWVSECVHMQSHEGILIPVQHRSAKKKKRPFHNDDGADHSLRLGSVFELGHLQDAFLFLLQLETQHQLLKLALLSLLLLVLHHAPELVPSLGQNFGHPKPIKGAPVLEQAQAGWRTWDGNVLFVFNNLRNAAPRHILADRLYLDLGLDLLVTFGLGSLTLISSLALHVSCVWNILTQGLFESGDVLFDLTELSEGVHVVCSRLWQVCHDWLCLWESWRGWVAIS